MATTNIAWGPVGGISPVGRPPVLQLRVAEDITPTGSSTQSSNVATPEEPQREGWEAAQITTDTAIRIAVGKDPVASATGDCLILANQTRDFLIPKDHKIAVIATTL